MKVALVRAKYTPFGGAEKFVDRAIEALRLVGAEPSLICQAWDSPNQEQSLNVIQVQTRGLTRSMRAAGFARAAHAVVASGDFDLVQTHERIPGFDVFRAGDGVHRTWMVQRARDISPLRRGLMRIDPFHRYQLAQEKQLLEAPSLRAVICNSHMVKQEILANFNTDARKIHVIYNGIDTRQLRPPTTQEREQARLSLDMSDGPWLVFLGSGFERKGVHHLLHAMALCHGLKLMIVGGDKHLERYKALSHRLGLSSRVHFAGPQKNPLPYLWAADGMVFPTLYDPCPNAVLEGMACGLGIVTTPHCGATELLNEQACISVSPWDHGGLAHAMSRFADADHARRAGVAARACAEPLTLQRMGEQLLALYRSLAVHD